MYEGSTNNIQSRDTQELELVLINRGRADCTVQVVWQATKSGMGTAEARARLHHLPFLLGAIILYDPGALPVRHRNGK